jgi:hypothetical protein
MVQEPEKVELLKDVLRPQNLEYTSALIVLDFDQPWEMKNSLSRWLSILSDVI